MRKAAGKKEAHGMEVDEAEGEEEDLKFKRRLNEEDMGVFRRRA